MSKRSNRVYRALAVGAAALLVAGGAVAVAGAAHGKAHKRNVVRGLVRAGVHADVSLVRADGSTDSFAVDRGQVTAASSTSVTLKRRDGKSVTVSLSTSTKIRGTIAVGKPALVLSRNGAAFRVRAPRGAAPQSAPSTPPAAKAKIVHLSVSVIRGNGQTASFVLDRGQVTATSSTSLTLKREDGKSVTFAVNAETKVKGKLAVGGKALVVSRAGTALRVLARATA